jgi:hypothetical protein
VSRRHGPLLGLLAAALALRAVAVVAISPGIWFSDSNAYVEAAATGVLDQTRVDGYALLVAPFWHAGSAAALIVVQHLLGVGVAVLVYALLVRRGVPRPLALLAVVPLALDAYLIVIEHTIMAETAYHAALAAGLALLLWPERPGAAGTFAAGLLLGYAAVTRSVAVPLVAVVVAYLLLRRVGWRVPAAFAAGWVLVAAGYAGLFAVQHGAFAFTRSDGRFLYAKAARFADCGRLPGLPADERALCPDPRRRMTSNWYLWGKGSPIRHLPPSADGRIRDFALRVIREAPLTYAGEVGGGVLHYFEPGHRIGANDYPVQVWQFPADPRRRGYPGYRGPIRPQDPVGDRAHPTISPGPYVGAMVTAPRVDVAASRLLHGYQRFAYTPGPVLAACVLLVLAAVATRRGERRLRLDAAFLATLAVGALAVSQALSVFSYRYGLVAPVLLPPAAALALTALRGASVSERARRRRGP